MLVFTDREALGSRVCLLCISLICGMATQIRILPELTGATRAFATVSRFSFTCGDDDLDDFFHNAFPI